MKKHYFLLVLIFSFNLVGVLAQVPPGHYIVTSDASGTGTGTFETAFAAAIQYANAGNHAYVEMNAPDLCEVDAPFPVCTLAMNAKITIRKADLQICPVLQSPIQGFRMSQDMYINNTSGNTINVFNIYSLANTTGTLINFNELFFSDFIPNYQNPNISVFPSNSCITIQNIKQVIVSHCNFERTLHAIVTSNSSTLLDDNLFLNTFGVALFIGENQIQQSCLSSILNNNFNNQFNFASTFQNYTGNITSHELPEFDPMIGLNVYASGLIKVINNYTVNNSQKITISNNTLYHDYDAGISIENRSNSLNNDLQIEILQNTIETFYFNLKLHLPYRHYKIEDNVFKIQFNAYPNIPSIPPTKTWNVLCVGGSNSYAGLDLIGANNLGYSPKNGNNQFLGPTPINNSVYNGSFFIKEDFPENVSIIGQNLPGRIDIVNGKASFSRANSIFSNQVVDQPQSVLGNEYLTIGDPPFLISTLNINNGSLIANYQYTTSLNNKKCFIDLYSSNTNGDLVQFLGSFDANLNGGISPLMILPSGINLSSVSRFAYITNTYDLSTYNTGNLNNLAHSGSSKASYIDASNITYCCPNLQASITLNGTTYNYDPNLGSTQATSGCFGELMLNLINCSSSNNSAYNWTIRVEDHQGFHYFNLANANELFVIPSNAVSVLITLSNPTCNFNWTLNFNQLNPCELPCIDCISSFAPIPGEKYILSAWVKEQIAIDNTIDLVNYNNAKIIVEFELQAGGTSALPPFFASGQIIETWQRIEKEFTIPANATDIKISLVTSNNKVSYFDDIRVFPAKGNMKSFVYDPESKRLMAELDERNYATFYEYNEEGKLSRIKKETEKGVYTIKESRSSLMKK